MTRSMELQFIATGKNYGYSRLRAERRCQRNIQFEHVIFELFIRCEEEMLDKHLEEYIWSSEKRSGLEIYKFSSHGHLHGF